LALIPNGYYRKGAIGGGLIKRKIFFSIVGILLRLGVRNLVAKHLAKKFKRKMIYPDFSLRYGAVAAGLGHLGWS